MGSHETTSSVGVEERYATDRAFSAIRLINEQPQDRISDLPSVRLKTGYGQKVVRNAVKWGLVVASRKFPILLLCDFPNVLGSQPSVKLAR